MPYFVYKIAPVISKIVKNLEHIKEFEKFKEAKKYTKELRQQQETDDGTTYKIIFAENEIDAEEKLQEHREETITREWEK